MVAAISSYQLTAIVVVLIVSVLVIGVLLYMLRRLKERRAQLLGELKDRPDLIQDRAFNRLAMARHEAEIIAKQGIDVGRPRELIAQSQAAFDSRNYERSYELAQQAHEALVHARNDRRPLASTATASAPASAPLPSSPSKGAVLASAASLAGVATVTSVAANLPKNRAESQFQLRLLDQEIASARASAPKSPSLSNAVGFRADAGAAFDRGDYTDAFRLALRGRRAIGASIESLPVVAVGPTPASDNERVPVDATRSAELAAEADRCPKCGYPSLAGDSFCRGCGEPRASAACPRCGSPRQPADTFCGRCGSAFG